MRFLTRGSRALMDEARLLLAALRDRRLALALGIFAALLLLAAWAPLHYAIQVGREEGQGSDLPLLDGFYPPEREPYGVFRWTSDRALIQLPGVGQRPLQMTLRVFPISQEVIQRGPREIELWDGGRLIERLPVRPSGAAYRLLLPPPDASGDHIVELRSATFIPTGDQRSIGSPVDTIYVASAGGPALPAWRSTLGWLGAALLAWLALRRAGFGSAAALALLLPGLLLAGLAALLDPPRFAFGAGPALIALALGWLLVLLLRAAAPALGDRFNIPFDTRALRWLLLFALLVFALRYGGKIYPDSMSGDIGFHANRYAMLVRGAVLQLSLNRGVAFPYPPAFYLLLAPFSLLGLNPRVLLQLSGALLDSLSPFLVYAIAARLYAGVGTQGRRRTGVAMPLLAAAIYSFSAAGFMTTWWNFSTHIFAQFAHLLLMTALVLLWRPTTNDERRTTNGEWRTTNGGRRVAAGAEEPPHRSYWQLVNGQWSVVGSLVVLQSLVYLGHFGFWMNTSLLFGIGLAALLVATWRGRSPWRAFRLALFGFVAAELVAALFFYSTYAGLFLAQIQATAEGGLTGLARRAPIDRAILWHILWDQGLVFHFGFFPLPLALGGLLLARRPTTDDRRPTRITLHASRFTHQTTVVVLMAGTFAIGLLFALLPFLSGSTLSTRWLMFSAWAVAVGAALSARMLWHRGRAGRLVVLLMSGYVLWITASMWLMALAWRVRPPEPF